MALFSFTKAILAGQPIQIFNHGNMERDFTYVDDVIECVARLTYQPPTGSGAWDGNNPDPATSWAPYRLHNIGNHSPVPLMRVVELLEQALGRTAEKVFLPLQPGDVVATYADVDSLVHEVDFRPSTPIETGIEKFVAWYVDYYGKGPPGTH